MYCGKKAGRCPVPMMKAIVVRNDLIKKSLIKFSAARCRVMGGQRFLIKRVERLHVHGCQGFACDSGSIESCSVLYPSLLVNGGFLAIAKLLGKNCSPHY